MKPETESLELIRRYIDGGASEADRNALQELLRHDPSVRRLFARYANTDAALGSGSILLSEPAQTAKPVRARWLSWRPLTAAAAGLVIGILSATAVWAIASGNAQRLQERELPLVDGGFELNEGAPPLSMPRKYGLWAGDPVAVVSEFQGIKPHSGQQMARYMASAMSEELQATSNASDLWQVLPLPGSGDRLVRIRAWFNAVGPASFSIGAVAGADGPESAVALWKDRAKDDPKVLAVGMKQVALSASTPGWQMAELLLQVPGPARVLAIDLAAHRIPGVMTNDGFPGQFVDDVSVTVADEPAQP